MQPTEHVRSARSGLMPMPLVARRESVLTNAAGSIWRQRQIPTQIATARYLSIVRGLEMPPALGAIQPVGDSCPLRVRIGRSPCSEQPVSNKRRPASHANGADAMPNCDGARLVCRVRSEIQSWPAPTPSPAATPPAAPGDPSHATSLDTRHGRRGSENTCARLHMDVASRGSRRGSRRRRP